MMYVKEAAQVLGLSPSNHGSNINSLCRKGSIAGAEYVKPGWRVPIEWVYRKVLHQAAGALCPKCGHKPLAVDMRESVDECRIVCSACELDVSPQAFAELRRVKNEQVV